MRSLLYVREVARAGSIRRAAEHLGLTPSALNRRILDLEAELGTPIFERLPRGMRATAAGELLLRLIRAQSAELDLLASQIEDLRGLRRGTVRIAASQAPAARLLPRCIAGFRERFPLIDFVLTVADHAAAMAALLRYDVDLILVVRPTPVPDLLVLARIEQPMVAVMAADHPLAARAQVRLTECAAHPLALPDAALVTRAVLEEAFARGGTAARLPALTCNAFAPLWAALPGTRAVSFQVALGAPTAEGEAGIVARPVDARDLPRVPVVLGQLRGRALPIAAARFAEALAEALRALDPAR